MSLEPVKTILHIGPSAAQKLLDLGLDLNGLMEVIERGERARAEWVNFDPINAGGWDAYRYRVRAVREIYCPRGWKVFRMGGLEMTASADDKVRLITRSGDAGVGIADATPQPEGEIGDSTRTVSIGQSMLFGVEWLGTEKAHLKRPEHETWMLLVHASDTVVRAELSLPSFVDEDAHVSDWLERILLPDFDPNDPNGWREPKDDDEVVETIDVPVIRKK